MPSIQPSALPVGALLQKYVDNGAYTDCYVTQIAHPVAQAEFVEAFYTTLPIKLERLLLGWFVARPSTDAQARQLATGETASFAAWTVEGRSEDQLLLCDFSGHTRSWLKVGRAPDVTSGGTRLYFGSAVVPARNKRSGRVELGWTFRALLGFHKLYSRVLLGAARSRLARTHS